MKINLPFLNNIYSVSINNAHYTRRLGYPKDYEMPEHIAKSVQWAIDWYQKNGNPWLEIIEVDIQLKEEEIYINNLKIQAPKIYKRFKKYQVKKALLIALTAGENVDKKTKELWSSDYPDSAFFLDTFAASASEAIMNFAVTYTKNWSAQKGMKLLSKYSPGYPGWDLKEQFLLMEILNKKSTTKVPITISETALLAPLKSQLSLIGIYNGEQSQEQINKECIACNFMDCSCKDKEMFIKV